MTQMNANQQQDLLKRFQKSIAGGIDAGRGIYQQALQGLQGRFGEAGGLLEGLGTQAATRARRGHTEGVGGDTASLVGRGLYNTTVLDSMKRGRDMDLEQNLQGIDESVRAQRSGLLAQQAGAEAAIQTGEAGFFERMQADPGLYAQLLQNLGMGTAQQQGGRSVNVIGAMPTGGGSGGEGQEGGRDYSGGGGQRIYNNPNSATKRPDTRGIGSVVTSYMSPGYRLPGTWRNIGGSRWRRTA